MGAKAEQKKANSEAFASMIHLLHGDARGFAPVVGNYSMDPGKPEIGKHYFVYDCPHCGEDAPFFEDRTNGLAGSPLNGTGSLIVACSSCRQQVHAPPHLLRSIQWNL